ncbi:hypothetical protein B0H13DRAFT_2321039 [Mycena leptocephala]|nr:hypothetical protein B0H13DRAFT_2321039 [Mycena leptocephala]
MFGSRLQASFFRLQSSLRSLFAKKRKPKAHSVFSTSKKAPRPNSVVVFSVLGVAGAFQHQDVGWMVLDWLFFTTLLASQPEFDQGRFRYRCIRDVLPSFPDGTFLFGEAVCDRQRFRLPSCLFDERARKEEVFSAERFVNTTFLDIAAAASRVKPEDEFIILLVGYAGERTQNGENEFLLCVTTKGSRNGEAWLSKGQLEVASSMAFALRGRSKRACRALMTSACGRSAFSLCALPEEEQECGLVTPFPRTDRRPVGTLDEEMVRLPTSRPTLDSDRNALHLLVPRFMPIAKSLRRDKEDVECCRRFLDDHNSLRDGEIMDLASRLRSRHIQSVVVQLISNELGWSSRTVVLFLSYADAKSGELVVNEMKRRGCRLAILYFG